MENLSDLLNQLVEGLPSAPRFRDITYRLEPAVDPATLRRVLFDLHQHLTLHRPDGVKLHPFVTNQDLDLTQGSWEADSAEGLDAVEELIAVWVHEQTGVRLISIQ